MQETHIYFSGNVQGVGLRATVKRHALVHDIKGFAKNLPDGRVEICAQGSTDQILRFIRTIKENPGSAKIESVETQYKVPSHIFTSFEIR